MKGRRFSFAFTGRERYLLKASSNSSRRPVRSRTWRHEFWFANEISTLPRISHSAIFSRAAFVFDSFHDELQLYGLFSQSDSFRAPLFFFPFIPIPFFPDLIALLSLSCRCHRSTSFRPVGRELSRRMPNRGGTCGMKFANGLNSNYPGVSFARFSRFAAFFTFVVFASSFVMCATAYCKNAGSAERDGSNGRSEVEVQKASVYASRFCKSCLRAARDCHWNVSLVV